jgi:hypothetical protein
VLDTWGSTMTHHPHVHMIGPGGGIGLSRHTNQGHVGEVRPHPARRVLLAEHQISIASSLKVGVNCRDIPLWHQLLRRALMTDRGDHSVLPTGVSRACAKLHDEVSKRDH